MLQFKVIKILETFKHTSNGQHTSILIESYALGFDQNTEQYSRDALLSLWQNSSL
jgi:hypothetical protein